MVKIKINGQIKEVEKGSKIIEAFEEEIKSSERYIIACRFNNEVMSLGHRVHEDGELQLLDLTYDDGKVVYIRGLLFLMSKAIHELYPDVLLTINYQLSNAMFAEFDNMEVTKEVTDAIQRKIEEIVEENLPITPKSMTKEEAQELMDKDNTLRGRAQLDNVTKDRVKLYFSGDYYNYFLGVMPMKTGFANIFSVEKYEHGFIIRYPDNLEPDVLQDFENNKKLLNALKEYEEIYKILGLNTLFRYNNAINTNPKDVVLLSEALHEKKIASLADEIVARDNVKVVLIAGPSSSGKTTFAGKLATALRLDGVRPVTISVDNYFVERHQTPLDEQGEYDFESIEAIDLELFNKDLTSLINGEEIIVPTFDFTTGTKSWNDENKLQIDKDQVLIIEGIHCLNDRLTYLIDPKYKFKVYISDLTVLNIDYFNRISTTDTRLLRRIVRDNNYRGYSALDTLQRWYSVRRGERNNIFPYQETADFMFNSSIIYELSVLKNHAIPLLEEIPNNVPEYSEAKRLISMLKYFADIDEGLIPNNSLLREFIGGSIYD